MRVGSLVPVIVFVVVVIIVVVVVVVVVRFIHTKIVRSQDSEWPILILLKKLKMVKI